MVVYVITLEPEKRLKKEITRIKDEVRHLVGDQLYLLDEPHLTLYIGQFGNVRVFEEAFEKLVETLRAKPKRVNLEIVGWASFKDDSITGRDTLVCDFAKKHIPALQEIQMEIVTCLSRFRRPGLIRRYQSVYDRLGPGERENLDNFGYPFVGEIWKPHFSIASFDKKAFSIAYRAFKDNCPVGCYRASSINLYALDEATERLELIKRWPLKEVQLEKISST